MFVTAKERSFTAAVVVVLVFYCGTIHERTPPPTAEPPTVDDDGARHWWRRDRHTAGYRLRARGGSSSGNTVANGFSVSRLVRVRPCVCVCFYRVLRACVRFRARVFRCNIIFAFFVSPPFRIRRADPTGHRDCAFASEIIL